jgi:hypothetical protein
VLLGRRSDLAPAVMRALGPGCIASIRRSLAPCRRRLRHCDGPPLAGEPLGSWSSPQEATDDQEGLPHTHSRQGRRHAARSRRDRMRRYTAERSATWPHISVAAVRTVHVVLDLVVADPARGGARWPRRCSALTARRCGLTSRRNNWARPSTCSRTGCGDRRTTRRQRHLRMVSHKTQRNPHARHPGPRTVTSENLVTPRDGSPRADGGKSRTSVAVLHTG